MADASDSFGLIAFGEILATLFAIYLAWLLRDVHQRVSAIVGPDGQQKPSWDEVRDFQRRMLARKPSCDKCGGPIEAEPCPVCSSRGLVVRQLPGNGSSGPLTVRDLCPACRGVGLYLRCPACDGKEETT